MFGPRKNYRFLFRKNVSSVNLFDFG